MTPSARGSRRTITDDDRAALERYARAIHTARGSREDRAGADLVRVSMEEVRWRRLNVSHAGHRLPATSHATAAFGGLQDSAPRAALIALHARMDGVDPRSWEHPTLCQIWFRWADYVIPCDSLGVFTLGAMPRDTTVASALERLADVVTTALGGRRMATRELTESLRALPNPMLVRASAVTGRVLIRWDARTTEVYACERPAVEVEPARIELVRRFLHWLGPATPAQFAKWAGLAQSDALTTWPELAPELTTVNYRGRTRWVLSSDEAALTGSTRPTGVRLLPPGDPCLYMNDDSPPGPPRLTPDPQQGITSRLLNSLTGRVVNDGSVVGAWGRVGRNVTIDLWHTAGTAALEKVATAAMAMRSPLGRDVKLRWLRNGD